MFKLQLEITRHTQKQDLKLTATRKLVNAITEIKEILELSDDYFEAIKTDICQS